MIYELRSDYAFTMPMDRERSRRRRCYGVVELYKSLKIERSFSIKVNEIKTDDDDDDSGTSAFSRALSSLNIDSISNWRIRDNEKNKGMRDF